MRISRLPRHLCVAVACATILAACGGGSGTGDEAPPGILPGPTGSAQGRITFVRGESAVAVEAEPNDDATSAQRLPDGYPGQSMLVFGELDAGGGDATDSYRVRFPVRSSVTVTVAHDAGDVSLSLYDPLTMQFIHTTAGPDPSVRFVGLGVVDLVLTSTGAVTYELTLQVEVIPAETLEQEPNDDSMSANLLGELRLGESLTLNGEAFFGADEVDAFLLVCPQDAQIAFNLTIAAFSDMLLRIQDATGGLSSPVPLVELDGPQSTARTGAVSVSAGTLLLVEVVVEAGGGPWRLVANAAAPGSPKPFPGGVFAQAPQPRVSSVDEESRWFATEPQYGRIPHELAPAEVLVRYCDGQEAQGANAAASRGCTLLDSAPAVCRLAFDLPAGQSPEQQARQTFARCCALAGDACVRYAEPNYICRTLLVPDDPLYSIQSWHYEMMNLPNAWNITTGDAGTIVAVIDTGRLNHPDLDARQFGGYDFVTGSNAGDGDGVDPNPDDHGVQTSYHGGHVAGTIGADSDNDLGVAGVTWAGRIMNVRVLGDYGYGAVFDIANGIYYAARLPNSSGTTPGAPADVINMSLGGGGFSSAMNDACQAAFDAGVVIFAAAGNGGRKENNYPASYASVISVMALDAQRNRAPYSSWGDLVDLAAPGGHTAVDTNGDGLGDGVFSTGRNSSGPIYHLLNGTSMACPHAAGAAALLLAHDDTLTPAQVKSTLIQNTVDLGTSGKDEVYGHGLIDVHAALTSLGGVLPPPPPAAILEVTPSVINFGVSRFQSSLFVRNGGVAPLDVTDAEVSTQTGGSWLSAALVGPADLTKNIRSVEVTVDRSGLSVGTYLGAVTLRSNGGDVSVSVLMQVVSSLPPPPNIDIYIQAVNAETGALVQERIVNPAVSLDYEFAGLPVGEYVFLAGSDIDGDGEVCEDGDFCGTYPSAGAPQTVFVTQDFTTPNINFQVLRSTAVGLSAP